jgi:hypothetical protein
MDVDKNILTSSIFIEREAVTVGGWMEREDAMFVLYLNDDYISKSHMLTDFSEPKIRRK